jgi:hypothetical protein
VCLKLFRMDVCPRNTFSMIFVFVAIFKGRVLEISDLKTTRKDNL